MISRLTTIAAAFAILTTASIAVAASLGGDTQAATARATSAAAAPAKTVELQRVVIVGKRIAN